VQVFNYAPGTGDPGLTTLSGSPPVTLSILVGAGGTNTYGEFATGTFTAEASTESFNWNGAGSSYTVLGSISVRKLSPSLVLSAGVTGGQFELRFNGTTDQSYTVELSTNLAGGNWTPVYTNTPSGGVFIFTTNVTTVSSFFRVTQ
jgi:hypothetical protein